MGGVDGRLLEELQVELLLVAGGLTYRASSGWGEAVRFLFWSGKYLGSASAGRDKEIGGGGKEGALA